MKFLKTFKGGLSFSYQYFMLQIFLYTFHHIKCRWELFQKSAKKIGGAGGEGSVTVSDFSKTFHLFYRWVCHLDEEYLIVVSSNNTNVFNLVPTYLSVILYPGSWFFGSIFQNFPQYFSKFWRKKFWICQRKLSADL